VKTGSAPNPEAGDRLHVVKTGDVELLGSLECSGSERQQRFERKIGSALSRRRGRANRLEQMRLARRVRACKPGGTSRGIFRDVMQVRHQLDIAGGEKTLEGGALLELHAQCQLPRWHQVASARRVNADR
jgi:hypothetical protein